MTDVIRTTVSLTVNGRTIEAQPGELLIEAAERAGSYVPRFCYHPRMEPVGNCRMCLVEVEGPRGATLQPACFLQVNEGMVVTTDSEKVKKAQDGVLEFLLANHPLDCPVCDKGGECPLQDQTLAHGSGETRFIEEKRHFAKPIEIGDLVLLDRERCIQCSRCTRFASEVAGEAQIDFAGRGDLIEVAPSPVEPFDSVFSGNTVQICPVGALTAKPYRFTARPWDLEQVESTCTTCAVGCRIAVQSSGNRLTRVLGIDSEPVNHGWLCDKGRFTLDAVDGNELMTDPLDARSRITDPLIRRDGELVPVSWGEALDRAATILRDGAAVTNGVGAIGGAALTNEAAFAWERFVRGVLGSENIDAQYGDGLDAVLVQALPKATIDEAAAACTVVTITGDLREELPILYLRLRESAVKKHNSIVEFAFSKSSLRSVAKVSLPVRPGEAHEVARALAGSAPDPNLALSSEELNEARRLVGETGEGVVFVVGRPNIGESAVVIETAIRTLTERFPQAKFLVALRRANVMGALDMGLAPGLAPGRGYSGVFGRDTLAQLEAMRTGAQKAVLLLGGCLLGNVVNSIHAASALAAADVVVVTGHGGATLAYADVVLPAAIQHERAGTVTNLEGRVTNVAAKLVAPGSAWNDLAIASELAAQFGQHLGLDTVEQASATIESMTGYPSSSVLRSSTNDGVMVGRHETLPARRSLDPMANPGIRSVDSVGLGARSGATDVAATPAITSTTAATWSQVTVGQGITIAPLDAYSLRILASRRLYDRGIAMQGSPALAALVPQVSLRVARADLNRLAASDGDVVVLVGSKTSLQLSVVADDELPSGVAELPFNLLDGGGGDPVRAILEAGSDVTVIRLETR